MPSSYFNRRRLKWFLLGLWPALTASARTGRPAEIHCVVRARRADVVEQSVSYALLGAWQSGLMRWS
jgi:hypothetical protein